MFMRDFRPAPLRPEPGVGYVERPSQAAARNAAYDRIGDERRAKWLAEDATRADLIKAMEESLEKKFNDFISSLLSNYKRWGNLSVKQEAAARNHFKRAKELDVERATARLEANKNELGSQYVGTPGVRGEFAVTVFKECRQVAMTAYGPLFVANFKDVDGNVLVYKGGKVLADATGGALNVGDKLVLRATVKSHDEYQGVRQTRLNRIVVAREGEALPLPLPRAEPRRDGGTLIIEGEG